MQCVKPLTAFRTKHGEIVFTELHRHGDSQPLDLPCGQCVGCKLERSRQWAVRCMHEKQMHEESVYITLTLDDYNLARLMPDASLVYRPFQLFIKRLRRKYSGKKIRFYMCGEYGERLQRPHYHAILFGIDFKDKSAWQRNDQGDQLYRSSSLEQLWPYGHVTLGDVTFKSAAYVARYIIKKINGQLAQSHYTVTDLETGEIKQKKAEFTHMSLRPGIGATWLQKFLSDVYPHGKVVVNAKQAGAPKYYDRKYKEWNPDAFRELQEQRLQDAYAKRDDNTNARLATKEVVMLARVKTLRRKLK